jgi:hypothetical protein
MPIKVRGYSRSAKSLVYIFLYTRMQHNAGKMTKIENDNSKVVVLRNKTNEGYFVRDILDSAILNNLIIFSVS